MKEQFIPTSDQNFNCPHLPPGTAAVNPKTVAEIVDEWVASKSKAGWSDKYVRTLKSRLGKFAAHFKCPLASVTTESIEDYLQSLTGQARTVNNTRSAIGSLYGFAKSRGYVPRCHPGVQWVERKQVRPAELAFFTPVELEAIIKVATPEAQLGLALSAFAGLRTGELARLDWQDISLGDGLIRVNAGKLGRRQLRMTGNLRDWLLPHRKKSGPVFPQKNVIALCRKAAAAAKVAWKRNGLRLGFIAHWLALTKDVFQAALEAGCSPATIKCHFLHLVSEGAAKAWFAIRPTNQNPKGPHLNSGKALIH